MANAEQLAILKQGVAVWNKWRDENPGVTLNLTNADLIEADLGGVNLIGADLSGADLREAELRRAELIEANLRGAELGRADLFRAKLSGADLSDANLWEANLREANLSKTNLVGASLIAACLDNAFVKEANFSIATLGMAKFSNADLGDVNFGGADLSLADFSEAELRNANLNGARLWKTNLSKANLSEADFKEASIVETDLSGANLGGTKFCQVMADQIIFANSDLSVVVGLEDVHHRGPSHISTDTFTLSKGKIPEMFLQGCGLSDWEIEQVKLYNPDLSNDEITQIQYRVYDLRATQALQISPLFISYSHSDKGFVEKIGNQLTKKGIRYWRDIHDMKAGRMEKQIDRAIRQNPTVLLVLSQHSLSSDWVEHEVRTARALEKDLGRDILCPVALDDSWKSSPWPKRIMEQIKEYNILDFSAWEDDSKFEGMFRKLIDGLELFYKG